MSLKDRLDEGQAEAWRPEPGDELIGKVVGFGSNTTSYGTYRIIVVKPDGAEGPKAFHAFHTVAERALESEKPTMGDEIGIRYLGKIKAKEGADYDSYQGYRIVVEHPPGWTPPGAWGDEAPPEPASTAEDRFGVADEDIPF